MYDWCFKDFCRYLAGVAVNFQPVATWNHLFMIFLSLVYFLTQMRMLYVLRYVKTIGFLSTTLASSGPSLASFGVVIMVIFMAYCRLW